MKKLLMFLLTISVIGCAPSVTVKNQPIIYQFMPDSVNVFDSLLDTIAQPKDTTQYDDFKTLAINSGKGITCVTDDCKKTQEVTLPPGNVFSDRKLYKYNYYVIKIDNVNKRLVISKSLLQDYYKQIKAAQKIYNDRIVVLENENKRTWFETNAAYVGLAAGIISTLAVEYIAVQTIK
jgi:hypothetical protein